MDGRKAAHPPIPVPAISQNWVLTRDATKVAYVSMVWFILGHAIAVQGKTIVYVALRSALAKEAKPC
jgi:hypothetical protein